MSGSATELLDLVARWIHVLAGIMWIGNSLLFNWLDRRMQHPKLEKGQERNDGPAVAQTGGSVGTIWLLHSGGFYFVEKTLLAGEPLPAPINWFKWQSYTTWLTGMALLVVVYYLGERAVLADPTVATLSHTQAVSVGLAAIFGGWMLYESMNRFVAPRAPLVAAVAWVGGLIAIAVALTRLLNGHAAFLHVGAMMGTIMAGNVVFTIVPSQRELIASVARGQRSSLAALSARAKRVSIHNNYFTFPVIVLMVSGHFPSVYGTAHSWFALLVLIAGGAAVRHVLNLRFTEPWWRPVLILTMAGTVLVLWTGLEKDGGFTPPTDTDTTTPVTFAEARHVIDRRCGVCHSVAPSDLTFGAVGPLGVTFDTPEQILARVPRIKERAVVTRTMPPANKTRITDAERALLGRWISQGAVGK